MSDNMNVHLGQAVSLITNEHHMGKFHGFSRYIFEVLCLLLMP